MNLKSIENEKLNEESWIVMTLYIGLHKKIKKPTLEGMKEALLQARSDCIITNQEYIDLFRYNSSLNWDYKPVSNEEILFQSLFEV